MATIVQHKENGNKYVMLGAGFGMYQSKKPNWLLGDLASDTQSGQIQAVCVCDESGNIGFFRSEELSVLSIDGKEPGHYLQDAT